MTKMERHQKGVYIERESSGPTEDVVRLAVITFLKAGGIIRQHEPDPRFAEIPTLRIARPMCSNRNAGGAWGVQVVEVDSLTG